jgi:hypothetical protein
MNGTSVARSVTAAAPHCGMTYGWRRLMAVLSCHGSCSPSVEVGNRAAGGWTLAWCNHAHWATH